VAECAEGYVLHMKPAMGSVFAARRRVAPPWRLARLVLSGALIVGSAAAVAAGPDDQSAQTETSIAANWTPRKLHLTYMGFTAHYSCDGLREQMKSILRQLGAREDLVVKPSGCTRLQGPEPFPGLDATFSVLEPAGGGGQGAGDARAVAARWEKVTLNSDTPRRDAAGGCELIEQVKKHVLPLFATRNLIYSSDCFPHAESLAGARLSVEVLLPVKPPLPKSAPR